MLIPSNYTVISIRYSFAFELVPRTARVKKEIYGNGRRPPVEDIRKESQSFVKFILKVADEVRRKEGYGELSGKFSKILDFYDRFSNQQEGAHKISLCI